MPSLRFQIVRFVDEEPQPGIVESKLRDTYGLLQPFSRNLARNLRSICNVLLVTGETMRSKLTVLALAVLLVAAIQAEASILPDSCGNDKIKFEVKTIKDQSAPAMVEAGKAQLILIQSENHMVSPFHDATVRWGMDGSWVGADNGNSYFSLAVDPGIHHVCANWQSAFKTLKKNVDLTSFTAESGHIYYFQVDVNVESKYSVSFALSQINGDKGQYLVKTSALSTSKPK